LIQVRAVILRMPKRDLRRGLAPPRPAVRGLVLAVHGYRRRVVVHLRRVHIKLADHADDQVGEQAGPVRVEESDQRPAHPVVIEPPGVPARRPEQVRRIGGGPLAEPVQGCPADQQIDHEQPDRGRRASLNRRSGSGNRANAASSPMRSRKWLISGSAPHR
jgi:hypothetical protein